LKYEIVNKNSFTVVGIFVRTNFENAKQDINATWNTFFKNNISEKILHKENNDVYALYYNYEGDYTQAYSYLVGYRVTSTKGISEDFKRIMVPAQTYARFQITGEYPKNLIKTWMYIWGEDFHRSYNVDFEVYPENFDPNHNPNLELYLGIENQ